LKSVRYILLTFLACAAPGFAAVTVTSPANNATVSSPVNYVATATTTTCAKGVASMGIYVSNKLIYVVDGHSLNTTISLSPGTYSTVVEEWDHCKGASVTPIKITVGTVASNTGVSVTSPVPNSTVTSPVNYVATATSSCAKGVASMGVYVDNKLVYVVDAAKLNTSLSLAAGAEHTVVEEWDHCGKAAHTTVNLTVGSVAKPAVSIAASPASISPGSSSTLTVVATNATQVMITGTDGSSYTLPSSGGTQVVSPTATTTYTAVATGAQGNTSAATTVTVTAKTLTAISVSPSTDSLAVGANEQFTATATYSDNSTANVTATATWTAANTAAATINSSGLATAVASGSTQITASLNGIAGNAALTVTAPSSGGANVVTWHFDAQRSGLNPGEQTLTPSNVTPTTFGKLFSYLVDGYMYAEPLLVSGLTVNGGTHNVVYVATENDSVYAFDADNYGSGTPLWQVSLLQSGESPVTGGELKPFEGVTSTPVIDLSSNTIYVVSMQVPAGGSATYRLNALNILTGAQKFGGPMTIQASVPGTASDAVNGVVSLPRSCIQRSALLLADGTVYIGFGNCHSGWLLAYNAQTLTQTGVFNASPNLDGEGTFASAGGVWMGSGGPVSDGAGNVYVTTGNGPWDGQTAWSDSVLKFNAQLQMEDYFTPNDYQYMDCNDSDLAAGGLLLIPGTSQLLAGGKTGKLYLVNSANLGQEQANDTGATQTLWFESTLSPPYSSTCTDEAGAHTTDINSYEIFGTAAYFNGSVYLGVTPTSTNAPAGVGQFAYSGSLTPVAYTTPSIQENTRGTTPFISANGNANGILWMIDTGQPIQSPETSTNATLRAYDPTNLSNELYNSGVNSGDVPGYGIKFSSPIVANGKVYISTGHDLVTVTNPQGELDVYGLK
jgi:Bacterial Ig-like domain (group 2)/PQQ-like domain